MAIDRWAKMTLWRKSSRREPEFLLVPDTKIHVCNLDLSDDSSLCVCNVMSRVYPVYRVYQHSPASWRQISHKAASQYLLGPSMPETRKPLRLSIEQQNKSGHTVKRKPPEYLSFSLYRSLSLLFFILFIIISFLYLGIL